MNQIDKQEAVFKDINVVLENIDSIVPQSWSKSQIASVFSVYLEIYK